MELWSTALRAARKNDASNESHFPEELQIRLYRGFSRNPLVKLRAGFTLVGQNIHRPSATIEKPPESAGKPAFSARGIFTRSIRGEDLACRVEKKRRQTGRV